MATQQFWIGQCKTPSTSVANYWPPQSGCPIDATPLTTEANASQIVSHDGGTLKSMKVRLSTAPGAGTSYRIQVVVNTSPSTALDITISDTDTFDTVVDDVSLSAGDRVSIKCTPTGSPASTNISVSLVFEPTTDNYFVYGSSFGYGTALGSGVNHQVTSLLHTVNAAGTTNQRTLSIVPFSGTIREVYIYLATAPGSGKTQRFAINKYHLGSISTLATYDISDTNTSSDNSGLSFAVAAGDTLEVDCSHISSPAGTQCKIAVVIEPDTAGLFALLGYSATGVSYSSGGNYIPPSYGGSSTTAPADSTEANVQAMIPNAVQLSAIYFRIEVGSNTGSESITIKTRINGSNGNLSAVSNSSSPSSGVDSSHTDDLAEDDLLALEIIGANSGDLDDWTLGIACKVINFSVETVTTSLSSYLRKTLTKTHNVSSYLFKADILKSTSVSSWLVDIANTVTQIVDIQSWLSASPTTPLTFELITRIQRRGFNHFFPRSYLFKAEATKTFTLRSYLLRGQFVRTSSWLSKPKILVVGIYSYLRGYPSIRVSSILRATPSQTVAVSAYVVAQDASRTLGVRSYLTGNRTVSVALRAILGGLREVTLEVSSSTHLDLTPTIDTQLQLESSSDDQLNLTADSEGT